MQYNLTHLAQVFSQIPDPRSKHGTYQPSAGILALTFLGLLAGQNYFTHICRWAKNHWKTLKEPLGFKTKKPPNRTTISRLLAKISLNEMQEAFAGFLSQLLQKQPLTVAVDGKVPSEIFSIFGTKIPMVGRETPCFAENSLFSAQRVQTHREIYDRSRQRTFRY